MTNPEPKGFQCAAGCGHHVHSHRAGGCYVVLYIDGVAGVCGCGAPFGRIPPGDPAPSPVVIPGSGVPEVEQDTFEEQVAAHLQRLAAEREPAPRVRTGYQCAVGGDACPGHVSKWLMCSVLPTDEEQPGGAAALRVDVVTSVLAEVKALRVEIQQYGVQACRNGPGPMLSDTYMELAARLDWIESLVGGEQR